MILNKVVQIELKEQVRVEQMLGDGTAGQAKA